MKNNSFVVEVTFKVCCVLLLLFNRIFICYCVFRKASDSQSRGPGFKTIEWYQGQLSLLPV